MKNYQTWTLNKEFISTKDYFKRTIIPITQEWFVLSLVEIGTVVLAKKTKKISSMPFLLFQNYLPLKKAVFGRTWPSGSGEDRL